MYEREKEIAHAIFIARFRWNDADTVILTIRGRDKRPCMMSADCQEPATATVHDYEDDISGGMPVCDEHASELVHESCCAPEWVSQDPEEAWNGVGSAAGNGWSGLWFLFAPVGRYASPMSGNHRSEWPIEERSS